MRLILIRHGESVGNLENRLQGHEDYELTPRGERQAELTAQRLLKEGTTAIYSSPLRRALATAEVIGTCTGCKVEPMPGLSEYHFGELSGMTYAELRQRFGTALPLPGERPPERVYPGEEGREAFFDRVTSAFGRIAGQHPGETVAVVSHGGPIALYCQTVLGLPYARPMPFVIQNCALNVISIDDDAISADGTGRANAARLVGLNDICHLEALDDRRIKG
jgi:probable phosphoglycerate mutase